MDFKKKIIEKKLDNLVSFAVLIPAIGLIAFMFMQTFMWLYHWWSNLINLIIWSWVWPDAPPDFHTQAINWLQAVATIVILVKAYKILMSYVNNHHLSIKYLLEINFTAASLEILFNEASYSLEMKILFLILWLSSLLIYLIFSKQILELEKWNIKH